MNSIEGFALVALFVIVAVTCVYLLSSLNARRLKLLRQGDPGGQWVAEVWLDWEICRGSTMFRAAYSTQERAAAVAQVHAKKLDAVLPKRYRAEMCNGQRYYEEYNFSLPWGVRERTAEEVKSGVSLIWSTVLPGHTGHTGEHREAHPLLIPVFSGGTGDFKI